MNEKREIKGYLEHLTQQGILQGWAVNPLNPDEPARIYVYVNQAFYTVVNADQRRDDLRHEGIRNGFAGFTVDISGTQLLHAHETLEVRAYLDVERTLELNNSPFRINAEPVLQDRDIDPGLRNYTAVPLPGRTISCYFEGINGKGEIYGWACDPQDAGFKPTVYLYLDDFPFGFCQADQFRNDLKVAGITDGAAGFSLGLSPRDLVHFRPGQKIHAYLNDDKTHELTQSPYELSPERFESLKTAVDRGYMTRLTGTLEGVNKEGKIRGWGRDPLDSRYKPIIYFFVDGLPLGSTEASEYRGDLLDAGFADGKCAFTWGIYSFNGLLLLENKLQLCAYFDPHRQHELSESPVALTRSGFRDICNNLMDTRHTDITNEARITFLREMLLHKTRTRGNRLLDDEYIYTGILNHLAGLYATRQYHLILDILDYRIIQHRIDCGLAFFELSFFRFLSTLALGQLDELSLHQFEGLMYREIENETKKRNKSESDRFTLQTPEQDEGREGNDVEELDDSEDDREEEEADTQQVELGGKKRDKSKNQKNRDGNQPKYQSTLWIRYDKCLRATCIDNFNQAMVTFSTMRNMSPHEYRRLGLYLQTVARCLAYLFNDHHLAINYLNIMSRDGSHEKSSEYYALSGRLHRHINYNYEALQFFLLAAHLDSPSWRVYHEAGVILDQICENKIDLYRHNRFKAVELFARGLQLNPQQSAGLKLGYRFLRKYSRHALDYTKQLARLGEVGMALRQRQEDCETLARSVTLLRSFADASQPAIPKRIKQDNPERTLLFIASRLLWQCFYYRTKQKLDHAHALGWTTRYLDIEILDKEAQWKKELMSVDVLYVGRLPATFEVLYVMDYAKSLNIPVIYDIDDLIFDDRHFPSPLESYAGTIHQDLHVHLRMDNPLFRVALAQADIVTCSTAPLAEYIRGIEGFDKPVILYPNLISEELRINAAHYKKAANETAVEIFYGSATKAHKQIFYELLCPALAILLDRNPALKITLIGYFSLPHYLYSGLNRINVLEPSPNYMGYIGHLRKADINIAILEQDGFTDCKSELNWFEAGVFGIPSVVTPTATYRQVLEPEKNVLFASTTEEWIQQLTRLIHSASFRQTLGEQARKDCLTKYHPDVGSRLLKQLVSDILKPANAAKTRTKILFVNVFFCPQSLGGATRIVESHIRYLMDKYPDEFEIHVLTTEADPGHWPAYSVDQYYYGNARVTKLRIPAREWAEYQDEKVHAFCLEYYRRNAFDMIHFHSIQVLTASVVDAARDLKIPYLITLHDGWWLSRYLFLMDDKGNPIDPSDPFSGSNVEQDDMLWLLERKTRMYACLHDAHRVLAVSGKFRQLHEESAISARFATNENGLELFDILDRKPHTRTAVRIAHIGGMSHHKGFDLLREAVIQGNFSQLDMIVIDHALEPGESYQDRWGTTPVTFMAKTRQSDVNRLYAQMDVLVAPSLWPESYGLVTREALYAGVWVIASDRGAVGDAIREGVDGRVVDVNTPDGLLSALREIDMNPEPFTRQRASVVPRLAETQAEECVTLYRSILEGKVH